ncbi:hypothetical protein EV127DRAFT_416243 [Xylaria flabelliformis]|nr:hypothetical protein EV127DRAFT_416243 [Xylaria flabelliformis]
MILMLLLLFSLQVHVKDAYHSRRSAGAVLCPVLKKIFALNTTEDIFRRLLTSLLTRQGYAIVSLHQKESGCVVVCLDLSLCGSVGALVVVLP